MLRPSNSILGSSRAARRRAVREDRKRALAAVFRAVSGAVKNVVGAVFDVALLCGLPLLYLASAYIVADFPVTWLTGHRHVSAGSLGLFFGAGLVAFVGLARAIQGAEPVAPVRAKTAKLYLGLAWLCAVLFTIADVAA